MWSRALLACGLLALAFAARTYGLFESSIWVDDVWSIAAASGHSLDVHFDGMPAGENYADPPGPVPASYFLQYLKPRPGNTAWKVAIDTFATESHPPLFYLLLHFWMSAFGYTVTVGRALSLLFSLTALVVLFFLARQVAGETAAWIATLLCAMAPIQSQLAIQIRGYALFGLLVLATTSLTFNVLEQEWEASPNRARLLTWLGVTGMLTHYYFSIYSFLQGLALLTQRRLWSTAGKVGAIWTAVLAALGWYFLVQPSALAQPWMKNPWDAPLLLLNGSGALSDLLVLDPDHSLAIWFPARPAMAIKFLLVSAVGMLLFVAARHLPKRHMVFLLIWLCGPVSLMFVLDIARQSGTVMTARYFCGSSFALYLLLGAGLAHLKPVARGAVTAFLVLVMLAGQIALRVLPVGTFSDGDDCRRAAIRIGSGWKPQDIVVVLSNYSSMVISLAYYLPPETPVLPLIYLPRAEPGPVVMRANLDTLRPRLNRDLAGTRHLWVARSFTDGDSSQMLEAWLRERYRTVSAKRYGSLVVTELIVK